MAISSEEELMSRIQMSLGALGSELRDPMLGFAAHQALDELGWTLPTTDTRKDFWLTQRGKRHSLDILRTNASYKFRYKQIHLNQRFEHLNKLIQVMDAEYNKALGSDPILLDVESSKIFGTYVGNGFVYDQHGNDVTKLFSDLGYDNNGYREAHVYYH